MEGIMHLGLRTVKFFLTKAFVGGYDSSCLVEQFVGK